MSEITVLFTQPSLPKAFARAEESSGFMPTVVLFLFKSRFGCHTHD